MPSAESPAISPAYWTHGVDEFPGPVAQFRMSQLVDYDLRLTDPARVVYRFLIGWYMHTRGDALASIRHIVETMHARAPEGARHFSRSAVQRAIDLLIKTGWLVRTEPGNRGRASRYVPVLNVLDLATQGTLPSADGTYVPPYRDATDDADTSHATGTQVSHATGTQTPDTSHATGTKTLLLDPRTDAGTSNSKEVSAEPALAGLAAATPASGFERIWTAYGRLGSKSASREAWAKLVDPDVNLIAERAASWAASAKLGQKRMPLEKWLALEKYDEADRQVAPKERKPKDQPTPEPANDDVPDSAPSRWPVGEFVGQFVEGHVTEEYRETIVDMIFRVDSPGDHLGLTYEHRFWLCATVQSFQDEGQATMNGICRALGLRNVTDTDFLLGKPLIAISDGGGVEYRPVSQSEVAA